MADQEALAAQVTRFIAELFNLIFDWSDIDGSTKQFTTRATPKILQFRELSRRLSSSYLTQFRKAENPASPTPAPQAEDDVDEQRVAAELASSSGGVLKKLSRQGYTEEEALRRGRVTAAAKATKIVSDGGRRVLQHEVTSRNGAIGYARVVDADPCPFCAMLASRGVSYTGILDDGAGLYRSDSFQASNVRFQGDGKFKVHDGCCCTLEPVYKRDGKIVLPGNGDRLAQEWAAIAAGRGKDSFNTWRRWRDSSTLPDDYDGDLHGVKRPTPARGRARGVRKARPGRKRGSRPTTEAQYREGVLRRANRIDEEISLMRAQAGRYAETVSAQDIARLEDMKKRLLSHINGTT